LAKYLVKAFKDHFGSSLKEWKKYLKLVKTSSFIMSGKFKVTLLWAIRFSVMDRLKAGELGVDADKIPVDQSEKAQKHIESLNETEKCKEIRREIVKRYGSEVYNSQFTEILLAEIKGKTVIKYPDNFTKYQIRNRFPDVSERLTDFEDQLSSEEKIEFQIESLNETEKCKEVRKKIAKKFGEHTYDSLFEAVQLQEKDGKLMIKRFNRFNSFIKNKVEKEREYADILVDYEIMTEPENQFNSKEEIEPEERVRQHIDAVNETGKCKEIRRKIAKKFGTDTYNFLFTEVRFWEEEEKITIKYPNFLSRRRIQKKYAEIFTDCGITETEEEKRRLISFEEEAQLHIESLDETKKCKEVRKNIVKKLGERVYINFFKEVQLQEKDEKLSITYPKLFRKEWIPKRYADIFDGITGEYEEEMKSEEASSEKEMQRTITLENEVQRHIEFSAETEKCKEVRRKIVKKLGVETYNTYFRKIQFQEKNGKLSAIYLDSVMEWWIQKKYAKVLIDCGIMPKFANRFGEENNMIQCQNPGRKSEFHVISSERGGQRLKTVRPILKTLDSLLKTPLSTAA
jgi:ribosomal protein L29